MPSAASLSMAGTSPTVETVTPRAEIPSPSGRGVGDPPQRRDHAFVVRQGLAHAHEHDVGQPGRLPQRPVAGRGGGLAHLVDDLGGGQVALQPALAGRAERARHPAARLAGDARRGPVRIAHEHRLGERAVVPAPQRLAGGAAVAGLFRHGGDQRREQRGEARPGGRGQVRHGVDVRGEPAEVVAAELVGPESGQAQLADGGPPVGGVEVGEVARRESALGGVEDEGQGGHVPSSVPARPRPVFRPASACRIRSAPSAADRDRAAGWSTPPAAPRPPTAGRRRPGRPAPGTRRHPPSSARGRAAVRRAASAPPERDQAAASSNEASGSSSAPHTATVTRHRQLGAARRAQQGARRAPPARPRPPAGRAHGAAGRGPGAAPDPSRRRGSPARSATR